MIASVALLVIAGLASGLVLTRLKSTALRRTLGWLTLAILILSAHWALEATDSFFRMVGICCVLLGGMKGLVYAEWAREESLTLTRYAVFSCLWFGMDPGTFRIRRKGLSWKGDAAVGVSLLILGIAGAWVVWRMEWRQILVMFVPLSLGFHYGVLRILKSALRLAGFPVRTLFPNLLCTRGIGDFWSLRWNVGYSQMMQRLVGRPVGEWLGERTGILSVFFVSGLLHELAITVPARTGYGLPTFYFTLHGVLTLIEKAWGRPIGKVPALLAVALPLGWLFPPVFQEEVIGRCLDVFDILAGF